MSWRNSLDPSEWEEVVDYIIVKYSSFDYEALLDYYDSYENMLIAVNSNTGGEYDIREEFNAFSDLAYGEMLDYCRYSMTDAKVRELIMWPIEKKLNLFNQLKINTSATDRQISVYGGRQVIEF